jgi:hypothetical protein
LILLPLPIPLYRATTDEDNILGKGSFDGRTVQTLKQAAQATAMFKQFDLNYSISNKYFLTLLYHLSCEFL